MTIEQANEFVGPLGYEVVQHKYLSRQLHLCHVGDNLGIAYAGTVADGVELTPSEMLEAIDEAENYNGPDDDGEPQASAGEMFDAMVRGLP